ncbi:MAG: hypothetical protein WBO35_01150 [Candidatus Saccharimonadales bacterium]
MSKLPSELPSNLGAKRSRAKPKALKATTPKLQSLQTTKSKETIYVDVDDEITSIIEKVRSSKGGIVALVLPKRASMLQSVVNMRLLKRAADGVSKNLVLVTTESTLLPLAGMVGLHTASSPTSKPSIPEAPIIPGEDEVEAIDEPVELDGPGGVKTEEFDAKKAAATPVGTLAGLGAVDEEVIEPDEELAEAAAETEAAVAAPTRDKKLAVPSFDSFKKRIALGVVALIGLIAGWYVAFVVMPHAVVSLATQNSKIDTVASLNLDTATKELDVEQRRVPATAFSVQKNYTQQATATGQQNNGKKAEGALKMTTSVCSLAAPDPDDIPAGSSVVSNGHTYITQEKGSFSYTGRSNGCLNYASNSVDIVALKPGAAYNLGSSSAFAVKSGVAGSGSAAGGTDEVIKVITQADIDGAKSKIATQDATTVKESLVEGLQAKEVKALPSTFLAGEPQISSSAQPGDKADTVTVNAVVTYTMLGANESDLRDIIVANVKTKIDPEQQKIIDDGLAKASFSQESPATSTAAVVSMKATSQAGPEIDTAELKKQVAGKKAGQVKEELSQIPGVSKVEVTYSPFWVMTVPKNTEKIDIKLADAE